MALKLIIQKNDGTQGNYWRLVSVTLPSITKDIGIGQGVLHFDIYLSESAAKIEGKEIFTTKSIIVPAEFFFGWTLPNNFDDVAKAVYGKKEYIQELHMAEDLDDTIPIEPIIIPTEIPNYPDATYTPPEVITNEGSLPIEGQLTPEELVALNPIPDPEPIPEDNITP